MILKWIANFQHSNSKTFQSVILGRRKPFSQSGCENKFYNREKLEKIKAPDPIEIIDWITLDRSESWVGQLWFQ